MTQTLKWFLVLAFVLLSWSVAAADKSAGHQSVAFDPAAFDAQRTRIENNMANGMRYAEIGESKRRDVRDGLESIGRLLEGVTRLDQLKADERLDLFNLQEAINAILTQAAQDSRLVCTRHIKTGSHRFETRCKTVAQRRVENEDSQNILREVMRAKLPEIEADPTYNRGGGARGGGGS